VYIIRVPNIIENHELPLHEFYDMIFHSNGEYNDVYNKLFTRDTAVGN